MYETIPSLTIDHSVLNKNTTYKHRKNLQSHIRIKDKRVFPKSNIEMFAQTLDSTDWPTVLNGKYGEGMFMLFLILYLLDVHFLSSKERSFRENQADRKIII